MISHTRLDKWAAGVVDLTSEEAREVVAELRQLRQDVARLRIEATNARTFAAQDRLTPNGHRWT